MRTRPRSRIAAFSLVVLAVAATAASSTRGAGTALFSTRFGGAGYEMGLGATFDAAGNVVTVGGTESADFPTTAGAPDRTYGGNADAFVTALGPTGDVLISSYLGGSALDEARGVGVDREGNTWIAGFTDSPDFGSDGARLTARGRDAFVVKLAPTGALLFMKLLGGAGTDRALALALDDTGAAYVTGETDSPDFPTTPGAFDTNANGDVDGFVTKLTPTGELAYSTFLGGPGFDDGMAMAVDGSGAAYVTGKASPGFPTTGAAFDTSPNGGYDIFVTKVSPTGAALVYSTYLGGQAWDEGLGIDVDAAANVYVTGNIQSIDYPTTAGAHQTQLRGEVNAAVTKLDATGSTLVYSTFVGGSGWTEGDALAVDPDGSAVIAGHLGSADLPTTSEAFDSSFNGGGADGFLTKLDATGAGLVYSTYVGGTGWDGALTFALNGSGTVAFMGGATSSEDYPSTEGAFGTEPNGSFDTAATTLLLETGSVPPPPSPPPPPPPPSPPSPPPPPPPPPVNGTFELQAVPARRNVVVGGSVAYDLRVKREAGFEDAVMIDVDGVPSGASASSDVDASGSTLTLTVVTTDTTAPGLYELTITGTTAAGVTRSTTAKLDVHCCPRPRP